MSVNLGPKCTYACVVYDTKLGKQKKKKNTNFPIILIIFSSTLKTQMKEEKKMIMWWFINDVELSTPEMAAFK